MFVTLVIKTYIKFGNCVAKTRLFVLGVDGFLLGLAFGGLLERF
jgi:hypothetical protein